MDFEIELTKRFPRVRACWSQKFIDQLIALVKECTDIWYINEIEHYKDLCRELEIENLLLQGDFTLEGHVNLDMFEGRTVFDND